MAISRKRFVLFIAILCAAVEAFAQGNYLTDGNALLNKGDFAGAEKVFRAGIKDEPTNNMLQAQLAFAMIQQKNFEGADPILSKILTADSLHTMANWYAGISNYKNEKYRVAIKHFERVIPRVDRRSGEFISAHWFIAKAYGALVDTEGITSPEADRMFECFDAYLKLQPNAADNQQLRDFVTLKKKRRPDIIDGLWVDY